jgi:serine/threonine-protein kinase
MSPEQATAEKEITARSDVYSLASVLYEMLTGDPPHTGASAQQIIMKIVTEEPVSVTKRRKSVPPNVAAAVARALEKLPADRFESAREFGAALTDPYYAGPVAPARRLAGGALRYRVLAACASAVLLASVGGWLLGRRGRIATTTIPLSASVLLPDSLQLAPEAVEAEGATTIALSSDGRQLAFAATDGRVAHLYVRSTSEYGVRRLDGTEGASAPFFSPNDDALAFFTDSALERVSLTDGRVSVLKAGITGAWGGVWMPDGRIIFVGDFGNTLMVLSPQGDSARTVTCSSQCTFPDGLTDGRRILVTGSGTVYVVDLDNGEQHAVLRWPAADSTQALRGMLARLDGAGHLVYAGFDGRLLAAPFDEQAARLTGPPVVVATGLRVESGRGAAQFALSRAGVLALGPGGIMSRGILVRADRVGHLDTIPAPPADYIGLALSPDGERIAATLTTPDGDAEVEIIDAMSGRVTPWLAGSSNPGRATAWTADNRHVVFARGGRTFIGNPDMSTPPTPLNMEPPISTVYPTGDSMSYFGWRGQDTLVVVHMNGRPPIRVVGPDNSQSAAMIDDSWLVADQHLSGGRVAAVAHALDGSGRRIVLSSRFGSMLTGEPRGHEIIGADYGPASITPSGRRQTFFSIRYDSTRQGNPFEARRDLFTAAVADFPGRNYAVGMNGNRFIFKQHLPPTPLREIRIMSDWNARLAVQEQR